VKPNFRVLGKKAGKQIKEIQAELAKWDAAKIAEFEKSGKALVCGVECEGEDIQIVRQAKEGMTALAGFGLVAELDTAITDELRFEGLQREVVNRIQQRRKEMQLHLADRIQVKWKVVEGDMLRDVLSAETKSASFVSAETLCNAFVEASGITADPTELGDAKFQFEIVKS